MRTLTAQRLKKQVEHELKNRREMLDHLWEEAKAETEKLSALLTAPAEMVPEETPQMIFEEYREDDEDSYFEKGVIEW
jgi:hypothetical protein